MEEGYGKIELEILRLMKEYKYDEIEYIKYSKIDFPVLWVKSSTLTKTIFPETINKPALYSKRKQLVTRAIRDLERKKRILVRRHGFGRELGATPVYSFFRKLAGFTLNKGTEYREIYQFFEPVIENSEWKEFLRHEIQEQVDEESIRGEMKKLSENWEKHHKNLYMEKRKRK